MFWIVNIAVVFIDDENQTTKRIFNYLAIALNASVGFFIFLYSVVCNQKVKNVSKKIMRTSTLATKMTNSNQTQNLYKRKFGKNVDNSGSNVAIIAMQNGSNSSKSSSKRISLNI